MEQMQIKTHYTDIIRNQIGQYIKNGHLDSGEAFEVNLRHGLKTNKAVAIARMTLNKVCSDRGFKAVTRFTDDVLHAAIFSDCDNSNVGEN